MMDSTACLIRTYIFDIELPLQLFTIGQCAMHQDDPISGHLEIDLRVIAAGLNFRAFAENWTHTRVSHISFNVDVRSSHWS